MKNKTKEFTSSILKLQKQLNQVMSSFNTLFQQPVNGGLELRDFDHREPFLIYKQLLLAMDDELEIFKNESDTVCRRRQKLSNEPDSIDYFNTLIRITEGNSLSEILIAGILDIMTAGRLFDIDHDIKIEDDDLLHFQVQHAAILSKDGIKIISDYLDMLSTYDQKGLSRVRPENEEFLTVSNFFNSRSSSRKQNVITKLRNKAQEIDAFNESRAFLYIDGEFVPSELASIRPVEQFYGYREARELFRNFFSGFSEREENLPMLISSLPGLGKTHFTISYTLSYDNLTLIIAGPGELSGPLEKLIRKLALRKNRKFVIFFDDVDTRKIDWYFFRTHVGGSFVLPDNIAIVIASNYEFPANIASRGRGFTFPIFDEIECQKMVEDFLIEMGMHTPPAALVSVIAADYVEDFGQKKFEELSPRTLVRYLDRYHKDPKKRLKMLQMSQEEMIAKPDSQSFYEANKLVTERLQNSI